MMKLSEYKLELILKDEEADRDSLRKTVDENIKELGLKDAPRQELILE